jgi:hypothetical protein
MNTVTFIYEQNLYTYPRDTPNHTQATCTATCGGMQLRIPLQSGATWFAVQLLLQRIDLPAAMPSSLDSNVPYSRKIDPPWCSYTVTIMNDHSEALSSWVDAMEVGAVAPPMTVLHIDRHSDMNLPMYAFTDAPNKYPHETDARGGLDAGWLKLAKEAADQHADLANFQMTGVWAGVINSVIWVYGNGSETFRFTNNGDDEAACAGLRCPLRRQLQPQPQYLFQGRPTFAAVEPPSAFSPDSLDTDLDSMLRIMRPAEIDVSSSSLPLAEFELWLGHIDQSTTIERAASTIDSQPWILDIDLDVFMPVEFLHRAPPWAHEQPLAACSRYLGGRGSACHRWSSRSHACAVWLSLSRLLGTVPLLRVGGDDAHDEYGIDDPCRRAGNTALPQKCKRQLDRNISSLPDCLRSNFWLPNRHCRA